MIQILNNTINKTRCMYINQKNIINYKKIYHTLPPHKSGLSPADLLVISNISFLSKFRKTWSFCTCFANVRP